MDAGEEFPHPGAVQCELLRGSIACNEHGGRNNCLHDGAVFPVPIKFRTLLKGVCVPLCPGKRGGEKFRSAGLLCVKRIRYLESQVALFESRRRLLLNRFELLPLNLRGLIL